MPRLVCNPRPGWVRDLRLRVPFRLPPGIRELQSPPGCFAEFVVLDPTGEAVYNSSKWWGCIQVLADVTLAPGESRSHVFPWNLSSDTGEPLPGGHEYRVVPSFLWVYASSYQRFVSRTDVATFRLTGSTSSFGT